MEVRGGKVREEISILIRCSHALTRGVPLISIQFRRLYWSAQFQISGWSKEHRRGVWGGSVKVQL